MGYSDVWRYGTDIRKIGYSDEWRYGRMVLVMCRDIEQICERWGTVMWGDMCKMGYSDVWRYGTDM